MEVTGIVFRQVPCFSSNTSADASNSQSRSLCLKQGYNRKSLIGFDEFCDKSHLQYYKGPRMAIKEKEMTSNKKEMKKQLKLLKGLSKNLSSFSDMGFGLNLDDGLDEQVRGKMISEATEVLVGELQKLKAEKMELKRKKKEEKAKKKMMECKDSWSSSSSESECEKVMRETTSLVEEVEKKNIRSINCSSSSSRSNDKIEVCMGGKCKKSGAALVLEKFQKAVGGEAAAAAVVGCKCMGKCRDGPNVKIIGNGDLSPPLCIGVGLEDVDSIVNNFFGGNIPSPSPAPAM